LPERAALRARAVQRLNATAGRRSATGEMRWCSTLFPTHALAQEADMSLPEYEEFVYRAMFLDQPDPIAAWQAFSMDQQKKADLLEQVETLRFVAEGTDLTVRVGGRKWMNSDGKRNFPSGEVFTGPIEDSANGTIRFTFPSLRGGREVDEARLSFRNGRVVEATAARGEDAMLRELDTDEGARYLGEVAIGNNYGIQRYTKNTLFDEKIGGTCHFALGKSYAETGGTNVSAIHWDLVCDLRQGGEVIADGKTIHRDGQWVV
jgi:aminopeptidase